MTKPINMFVSGFNAMAAVHCLLSGSYFFSALNGVFCLFNLMVCKYSEVTE